MNLIQPALLLMKNKMSDYDPCKTKFKSSKSEKAKQRQLYFPLNKNGPTLAMTFSQFPRS